MELYFADNGYYPPSSCGQNCNGYQLSYNSSWQTLQTALSPYMSSLPNDPLAGNRSPWETKTSSNNPYSYAYGNVGDGRSASYHVGYDLMAQLETEHSLRCELKDYRFNFASNQPWCGGYSDQLYDGGPN